MPIDGPAARSDAVRTPDEMPFLTSEGEARSAAVAHPPRNISPRSITSRGLGLKPDHCEQRSWRQWRELLSAGTRRPMSAHVPERYSTSRSTPECQLGLRAIL